MVSVFVLFSNTKIFFGKMANEVLIVFQCLLITIDILANSLSNFFIETVISQLIVYVVQDISLVLSLIILFLLFFNPFALQEGLLHLIFQKYWSSLVISFTYIILTVTLQILNLNLYWDQYERRQAIDSGQWKKQNYIVIIFIIQRILSSAYYFSYRFATIKLNDKELIEKIRIEK